MSNAPQSGKVTHVTWSPTKDPTGAAITTATPIVLSDFGRNFAKPTNFTTNDTTTYAEAITGYRTHVASLGDSTATMEVMYQVGATALWNSLAPGTTGTLVIAREGTGTGKPTETVTAIVTKRDLTEPYDNVSMLSVGWQISGAPTVGTAA